MTQTDTGGAGTATRRIHNGLRSIGVDSKMLVRDKSTDDPTTYAPDSKISKAIAKVRPLLDSLPLRMYDNPSEYSLDWIPDRIHHRVDAIDPDIVHLNWVGNGYMNVSSIADFERPIVWRLPDMWPLTGGCHYADSCTRYRSTCGKCPKLSSSRSWDPSRVTLRRKRRAVKRADVTVVATTTWLADAARKSAVFRDCRIETIPNGLDTGVFKPYNIETGRELFGLPTDVPLILFGSVSPLSNPRKGFDLLDKSLEQLAKDTDTDAEIVIFGTSKPEKPRDFGFPTHYTGYLNDEESLALLYSAADVMVVPSRYEGFGQTVSEALACGTPVVGFDATGPGEIIDHKETGYLASAYDPDDLAAGIEWILAERQRRSRISDCARRRAQKRYHLTDVAEQYRTLYADILD